MLKLLIVAGPYEADRIRRAAEAEGCEAVVVEPGESLSGWITGSRPHVIVLAPQIVNSDPKVAVAKIRSVPQGRVVLALVGDPSERERLAPHGDGFFARPVSAADLVAWARSKTGLTDAPTPAPLVALAAAPGLPFAAGAAAVPSAGAPTVVLTPPRLPTLAAPASGPVTASASGGVVPSFAQPAPAATAARGVAPAPAARGVAAAPAARGAAAAAKARGAAAAEARGAAAAEARGAAAAAEARGAAAAEARGAAAAAKARGAAAAEAGGAAAAAKARGAAAAPALPVAAPVAARGLSTTLPGVAAGPAVDASAKAPALITASGAGLSRLARELDDALDAQISDAAGDIGGFHRSPAPEPAAPQRFTTTTPGLPWTPRPPLSPPVSLAATLDGAAISDELRSTLASLEQAMIRAESEAPLPRPADHQGPRPSAYRERLATPIYGDESAAEAMREFAVESSPITVEAPHDLVATMIARGEDHRAAGISITDQAAGAQALPEAGRPRVKTLPPPAPRAAAVARTDEAPGPEAASGRGVGPRSKTLPPPAPRSKTLPPPAPRSKTLPPPAPRSKTLPPQPRETVIAAKADVTVVAESPAVPVSSDGEATAVSVEPVVTAGATTAASAEATRVSAESPAAPVSFDGGATAVTAEATTALSAEATTAVTAGATTAVTAGATTAVTAGATTVSGESPSSPSSPAAAPGAPTLAAAAARATSDGPRPRPPTLRAPGRMSAAPSSPLRPPQPPPPEEGTLATRDFDALLVRLWREGFAGRLVLQRDEVTRTLAFEDGAPVIATSTLPADRMADMLFREGRLSREQLERSREIVGQTGRKLGAVLVDLGFLKPGELFPAVRRHYEEIVYSLFAWERGTWRLEPGRVAPGEKIRLAAHPAALVQEGIRRKLGHEQLVRRVGPATAVLRRTEGIAGAAGDLVAAAALPPPEERVLALFDGVRSLGEVAAVAAVADGLVYAVAHGMLMLGVLERAGEDQAAAASARRGRDTQIDRDRLRTRWALAQEGDYFQVLGVHREASAQEIYRAYEVLSAELEPDAIDQTLAAEMPTELAAVREVLAESLRILADDDLRRRYRAAVRISG